MKYLYRSHLGGFYTTDEEQDDEALKCDTCGDWDYLLGKAKNLSELWAAMVPELSIFGSGGVSLRYAYQILAEQHPVAIELENLSDLEILTQIANLLNQ